MNSRYSTKKLVLCYPKKNTVDLTGTSNSELFLDDLPKYQLSTTDDEENDETEYPIEKSEPSPSVTAPNEKDRPSHIDAVPLFVTVAPVDIYENSNSIEGKNNISTCQYYSFSKCLST